MEGDTHAGTPKYVFIESSDSRMRDVRSMRFRTLFEPYGVSSGDGWDDLPPETRHLIALSGIYVVGCACMIPEGEWAHIRQVVVEAGYRRRGIATALIRELLGVASEEGLRRAYLAARLDAITLYDRLGFARAGPVFHTPLTNLPHVRMERDL